MARHNEKNEVPAKRLIGAKQVAWAVVAVVAVLFLVLNNEKTQINFLVASPEWPMWVMVVASMCLGFLLAKLTGWRRRDD